MSGISRISAYEIVGHIETINLALLKDGKKFGYVIERGEDHNYKPILSTNCAFSTKKKAAQNAIDVINEIIAFCEKESKNEEELFFKCDEERIEEVKKIFEKRKEEFIALVA